MPVKWIIVVRLCEADHDSDIHVWTFSSVPGVLGHGCNSGIPLYKIEFVDSVSLVQSEAVMY